MSVIVYTLYFYFILRQTQGVNVFLATTDLAETVLTRIQSTSTHHIEALLTLLEHLFYILSGVCRHKLLTPSSGVRKISDLLNMKWLQHFNVIGGNSFGGTNGQKWKEELIVRIHCSCLNLYTLKLIYCFNQFHWLLLNMSVYSFIACWIAESITIMNIILLLQCSLKPQNTHVAII